jgi:hypothetical protein
MHTFAIAGQSSHNSSADQHFGANWLCFASRVPCASHLKPQTSDFRRIGFVCRGKASVPARPRLPGTAPTSRIGFVLHGRFHAWLLHLTLQTSHFTLPTPSNSLCFTRPPLSLSHLRLHTSNLTLPLIGFVWRNLCLARSGWIGCRFRLHRAGCVCFADREFSAPAIASYSVVCLSYKPPYPLSREIRRIERICVRPHFIAGSKPAGFLGLPLWANRHGSDANPLQTCRLASRR